MKFNTLVIVGVGLIGGSIGLAARQRKLAKRIVGVGRRQHTLDVAKEKGAIDEGFLDLTSAMNDADLIVYCTPVDVIVQQVLESAPLCKPGALLTDAGSTKTAIVRELQGQLPDDVRFVGSHPLAGSHNKGPEHADADLFLNKLTVVTPSEHTGAGGLQAISEFWRALGSKVRHMTPEAHDEALAQTSHLPHLLASALAGILPPDRYELAATGFRDTTRIARGDPSIWTGIFQQNHQAVLHSLDQLQSQLSQFKTALENEDADLIVSLLMEGKKVRDDLGD